jgi:hypothetical protein
LHPPEVIYDNLIPYRKLLAVGKGKNPSAAATTRISPVIFIIRYRIIATTMTAVITMTASATPASSAEHEKEEQSRNSKPDHPPIFSRHYHHLPS